MFISINRFSLKWHSYLRIPSLIATISVFSGFGSYSSRRMMYGWAQDVSVFSLIFLIQRKTSSISFSSTIGLLCFCLSITTLGFYVFLYALIDKIILCLPIILFLMFLLHSSSFICLLFLYNLSIAYICIPSLSFLYQTIFS